MRPWRAGTPVKWPVGLKFAGAVGAVALGVLAVAVTAGIGWCSSSPTSNG